jgi:hypothetical protein
MEDGTMVYVAADPDQPGAAWAACVDDPRWAKDTAKDISGWVRKGATVMRVTPEVAREMMMKWVRPEKKQKAKKAALL